MEIFMGPSITDTLCYMKAIFVLLFCHCVAAVYYRSVLVNSANSCGSCSFGEIQKGKVVFQGLKTL